MQAIETSFLPEIGNKGNFEVDAGIVRVDKIDVINAGIVRVDEIDVINAGIVRVDEKYTHETSKSSELGGKINFEVTAGIVDNIPQRWTELKSLSESEIRQMAKDLLTKRIEDWKSGKPIQIVDDNRDENYFFDPSLQILLPAKQRILKTLKDPGKMGATMVACLEQLENPLQRSVIKRSTTEGFQAKSKASWDKLLKDLSIYLEIPKIYLGISFKPRSVIWGPLKYTYKGNQERNCLDDDAQIPANARLCSQFQLTNNIKFILITEDDSSQQEAVNVFFKDQNCLILSGSGNPDFACRRFAKTLSLEYPTIPFFYLSDCDPSGYQMYATVRYNCKSSVHCGEDFSIPNMTRIGVSPFDFPFIERELSLLEVTPEKTFESLSASDVKIIRSLRKNKAFQGYHAQSFQTEFDQFFMQNKRCHIQILHYKNIFEKYLKMKLKDVLEN
jgi:DNA topoisomerase VI subunit A